ncbi:MAG: hypothetical protein Q7S20_13955 [Gemmatimonadaceae bacterium]|nr:hypothetical protein [Gemmatimonadaceae bacterium]
MRTVLEGSVRRAGKRVRITAQLIDVTDGYHLWSERYDREIEDVFAVQDEIAAANAIRFAPDLAESHCARAIQLLMCEWNWTESERAFKRSMQLNPGYPQSGAWYHMMYQGFVCGASDDALAGVKAYQLRDQRSAYLTTMVAQIYGFGFSEPSAEVWVDRAVAMAPDAFYPLWARQVYLASIRDWPRAIEASNTAVAAPGRQVVTLQSLALTLVESGDTAGAHAVYDEIRARAVREYVAPMILASVEAALGDTDAAIAHCHEAVQRHDPFFIRFAHGWPGALHLQALPEYRRLAASIGLPGYTVAAND